MSISKYISLLVCMILLCACNEEEHSPLSQGYLTVSAVELECDGEAVPLSKAVSPDLKIEIWQNNSPLPGQVYEPGGMPGKIALSPGAYLLKAYTPGYAEEPADQDKGKAIYYGEVSFSIEADQVSSVSLSVPMINTGVSIQLSEAFSQAFSDFTILMEAGGRSFTINTANPEDVFYFMPAGGESLNYSISVVNKEGESHGAIKSLPVLPGKLYSIRLEF